MKVKVPQSSPSLCNPHRLQPSRLLCPCNSLGQNTGVGSCFFIHGIFPTHGSNPGLQYCWQILYHLSHKSIVSNINIFVSVRYCFMTHHLNLSGQLGGSYLGSVWSQSFLIRILHSAVWSAVADIGLSDYSWLAAHLSNWWLVGCSFGQL